MKVIHKYLRRFILWAQKPSDEEMRIARRMALSRNLLPMLRKGEFSGVMIGLSEGAARDLIEDALRVGAANGVDQTKVDGFIMEVEKYNPSIRKHAA